jgi:hypothetical protein
VRLRIAGATFHHIGETLGVTVGRAHQLVDEALRETVREPAEDLLKLELQRLDMMMPALMKKARLGRVRAINTMLKLMERQAACVEREERS